MYIYIYIYIYIYVPSPLAVGSMYSRRDCTLATTLKWATWPRRSRPNSRCLEINKYVYMYICAYTYPVRELSRRYTIVSIIL